LTRVAERLGDGASPEPLPVGDLGGGSDHKGFYQHLGIPAIGFGFGGPGGVYHSMYDTPRWMREFGDPGYLYHAAVARVAAVVVSRLANADILPYDFVELAGVVGERAVHLESEVESALEAATATEHAVGDAAAEMLADSPVAAGVRRAFTGLRTSIASMEAAAAAYSIARASWLGEVEPAPQAMRSVNEHLRAASLSLTSEDGLPGEAWSRQLLFASDPDNGYATLPLPAIRLALRAGDLGAVADRVHELADHLDMAAAQLGEALAVLEGQGAF
jgi:N-acetylated-alpha-linked acidic dipeptidase